MGPQIWFYLTLFLIGYAMGATVHRPNEVIVTQPENRGKPGDLLALLLLVILIGLIVLFVVRLVQFTL